jgi:hypothetical protein
MKNQVRILQLVEEAAADEAMDASSREVIQMFGLHKLSRYVPNRCIMYDV